MSTTTYCSNGVSFALTSSVMPRYLRLAAAFTSSAMCWFCIAAADAACTPTASSTGVRSWSLLISSVRAASRSGSMSSSPAPPALTLMDLRAKFERVKADKKVLVFQFIPTRAASLTSLPLGADTRDTRRALGLAGAAGNTTPHILTPPSGLLLRRRPPPRPRPPWRPPRRGARSPLR